MNRTLRKLMIPGVGIVLATSGFAFMASNSAAENTGGGEGTQAVTGYTIDSHTDPCGYFEGTTNGLLCNAEIVVTSKSTDPGTVAEHVEARAINSSGNTLSGGDWTQCTQYVPGASGQTTIWECSWTSQSGGFDPNAFDRLDVVATSGAA